MNNQQNIHHNDLDSRIENNYIQMMKASLPFMNIPQQRFISCFVKFNELQRTIHLFEDEEVAAMGICSDGNHGSPDSPIEMLNTIKPYATQNEQDFIDLILNFLQGFKIAGAYQDPSLASNVPLQSQSRPYQNNPPNKLPFDQIKNFIPPEQQSRLETIQMMMSAMQMMN